MNDFVMQLSADLLGCKISRPTHFDMSCLGVAFVAGLGVGKENRTLSHCLMNSTVYQQEIIRCPKVEQE